MSIPSDFAAAAKEIRRRIPYPLRRFLRRMAGRSAAPGVGRVRLGDLRRTTPISSSWGMERGTIIDRYYIEQFLDVHRADVTGRVLEVEDASYTTRFGGSRVTQSDVLHVVDGTPGATIFADLGSDNDVPSNSFDCVIFTHTMQMIFDQHRAARELYRILKPGGVLLLSVPVNGKIGTRLENFEWCVHSRLTEDGARRLFGEVFGTENVIIEGHGNLLAATASMYGLAAEELTQKELDEYDADYQVIVNVRATKRSGVSVGYRPSPE